MWDRILVALDGSETAEAVLPHVRRLLRRHDSELLLLRAVDPPVSGEAASAIEAVLAGARDYVVGIKDRLAEQGVRATAEARIGSPAGTILDVAEERQVSLIALATRGRTGLKRALLGSVAEVVLRKSPVPVFVARPFATGEGVPPGRNESEPIEGILVPTDLSDLSREVLGPAFELAKLFEARIVFLHVLEPAKGKTIEERAGDESVTAARLNDLVEQARAQGVPASEVIDQGEDVPKVILDNARFHGCDLIAMTTHGRSGLSRLVVGSVTEQVLRGTSFPVLIVRSGKKPGSTAEKAA